MHRDGHVDQFGVLFILPEQKIWDKSTRRARKSGQIHLPQLPFNATNCWKRACGQYQVELHIWWTFVFVFQVAATSMISPEKPWPPKKLRQSGFALKQLWQWGATACRKLCCLNFFLQKTVGSTVTNLKHTVIILYITIYDKCYISKGDMQGMFCTEITVIGWWTPSIARVVTIAVCAKKTAKGCLIMQQICRPLIPSISMK